MKAVAKRKRDGSRRLPAPLGRDKCRGTIRMRGVDGCLYKSGEAGNIRRHKASKHNTSNTCGRDLMMRKRDKWGRILKMCGVDVFSYKTGDTGHTTRHKAAKHNIDVTWHTCPNCDYKFKQEIHLNTHLKLNRYQVTK